MSQPPGYSRQVDFTDYTNAHPTSPHAGSNLDQEFNAVRATLVPLLVNLALLQRDDGALRNLLVTPDSLSAAVRALMVADWLPRGSWVTATAYAVKDTVANGGNTYICVTAHTSGTFATDLAAGKWMLLSVNSASGVSLDGASVGVSATNLESGFQEFVAQIRHQIQRIDRTARRNAAVASVPASSTVPGIVELATSSEAATGTDTERALTPEALHAMATLLGKAWFLDEDDMASDSAVKVPSQQSVKAYVDASVVERQPFFVSQFFPTF